MVTMMDQEGNMIEITNQQDMEEAILSNNHKNFFSRLILRSTFPR